MGRKNLAIYDDTYLKLNEHRRGGESWDEAFRRWLEQKKISR
jgi:predicted CopG family antitoxin